MIPAPEISVIIVTFNVGGFITFCLESILRCARTQDIEIIIVDNNSSDSTLMIIRDNYPFISIIENKKNLGFSAACNQGASISRADTLLFLNPDCILAESSIMHMYSEIHNKKIGIVGPLLIDGSGSVLPESAREIPSIHSSINKLLGSPLSIFNRYYRKIEKDRVFNAPVLSGACMMILKKDFDILDGFDEQFFMYGEDVDFSVRAHLSGRQNICVPAARVIHFKGESTDKQKLEYSNHFYNAMKIYLDKHIHNGGQSIWRWFMSISIKVAIVLHFVKSWIKRLKAQVIDAALIFMVLIGTQFLWSYIKSGDFYYYGIFKYDINYIAYTLIYIIIFSLQGLYFESEKRAFHIFKGAVYGTVCILILYALLPDEWRFSRVIILLSALFVLIIISIRYFLTSNEKLNYSIVVTGDKPTIEITDFAGSVKGNIMTYDEIMKRPSKNKMSIVFDVASLGYDQIINIMQAYTGVGIFEFWDRNKNLFFSSQNPDKRGIQKSYTSHYHLSQRVYLMHKRIFDILCVVVLSFPVLIFGLFIMRFELKGITDVFSGRKTIIGYREGVHVDDHLPLIKPCLITCYYEWSPTGDKLETARDYAINYTILDDVFISLSNFRTLLKKLN